MDLETPLLKRKSCWEKTRWEKLTQLRTCLPLLPALSPGLPPASRAEATLDPVVLRSADEIQRAHRTGKKSSATTPSRGQKARPRPIHVGYSSYIAKEKSKKSLRELFKSKKFGPNDTSFFASDDYSRKVQQLRKEKIPELKRLRKEGKRAYLAYPAEIRIQDSGPESNMDQSQS